jgi:hypothetical protein
MEEKVLNEHKKIVGQESLGNIFVEFVIEWQEAGPSITDTK